MRCAAAVVGALVLGGCSVTLKPDYTDLTGLTLPAGMLAPDYVPMNAAVLDNVADVHRICAIALNKGGNAPSRFYMACAITQPDGKCLLVKWTNTTWAHMGHEAGHCFFYARAMGGNTTGIPPHFLPSTLKANQ